MNRILLLAKRDYLQTVLSPAYLVGLVSLPLMIGGGFFAGLLLGSGPGKHHKVVVLDRTGVAAAAVMEACRSSRSNPALPFGLRDAPGYLFEEQKPQADESNQLLALSSQIRRGELSLVIDIRASALQPTAAPGSDPVRYYANSILDRSNIWLNPAVNEGLRRVRLSQMGVDPSGVPAVLRNVPVVAMNLVTKDPATGRITQSKKIDPIEAVAIPIFLAGLLAIVVLIGAAPLLGAVAEDKLQRVFEMLLCSAKPFELMMGKVLASLGSALTGSALYVAGGVLALFMLAALGQAPLHLLPWFFVYLIADVVMLSAVGVALGAACGSPQDAQHLAFVLFIPTMLPVFAIPPIMQQPNGALAIFLSFIPPFTPILMLLRQSLPGGVPWWQPWLGSAGIFACTIAVVWIAARMFRIGILSQGKSPSLSELARWTLRG